MKLLNDLNKEKEESRKLKFAKEKIYLKFKEIDIILRNKPINSFEKVYTSLAFQKIVDEMAMNYSLGRIDIRDKKDEIEVDIINTNLTVTDLKNILNREKQNIRIYSLLEALKEVDDFKIENNPDGPGIVLKVFKSFKPKNIENSNN